MSETLVEQEVTMEVRVDAANELISRALGEYVGRGLVSVDDISDKLLDVHNVLSGVTSDFEVLGIVTEPKI
jgi:hypothetical protein